MEVCEIYSEAEGSSFSDDLEEDPDFDITEETYAKFSNLSIEKNKPKMSVINDSRTEIDPEEQKAELHLDENDEESFVKVQKIIEAKELEKLKVPECKLYLRKKGLRLTGNKDTLIQRIKEHLEIINGGGERKYPRSSFVLNCKGDACTGDVVLFEQNVYEMFSVVSRSAIGPPCGKRIVAGRIVKESYGAAKQQHTFTIEVLWSKGEKPLPPLYPLLIKGRNLYRLKTLRQRWEDEGKRQQILMEKHSRGNVARASREARIQEKEKRKGIRENRASQKELSSNQSQSHPLMTKSHYQHEEFRCINPAKPNTENHTMTNRVAEWPYHRKPLTSSSYFLPLALNKESFKQKQPCKYYDQGRCRFGDNCKFLHSVKSYPQHFEEKLNTTKNYPCNAMPNRVEEWSYQHQESRCINPGQGVRVATRPPHFKGNLISTEDHPCHAMTNGFAEWQNI